MTPAEKALNLCQKFGWTTMGSEDNGGYTLSLETAKKCALISLSETIQVLKEVKEFYDNEHLECVENDLKYYELVKQEIEKLWF